ncbi:hypothetical protein Gpo141_00010575 [Globisporangium polare]
MRKRTSSSDKKDDKGRRGGAGGLVRFATRRERVQLVALVLVAVGFFSLAFRFSELPGAVSAARNRDALAQSATAMRGAATTATTAAAVPVADKERPAVTIRQAPEATKEASAAVAKKNETSPQAPAPDTKKTAPLAAAFKTLEELKQLDVCERERGLSLIDAVRASGKTLCSASSKKPKDETQVTLLDAAGGVKCAVFTNLVVNMIGARIFRPIKDLSQDGGSHDPRFVFHNDMLQCRCSELASLSSKSGPLKIWETALALVETKLDPPTTVCDPSASLAIDPTVDDTHTVVFTESVILIPRRDDHNPFFQVSNALNTWIVARALDWDFAKTRVVHFDAGYPSPVDALHQKLLSPNFEIVNGESLMGKRVHFKGQVMVAPYEVSGPMMQHLNDDEPCYSSQLFKDFRHLALTTMGAPTEKQHAVDLVEEGDKTKSEQVKLASSVVVTVITRRPYKGRKVQRVWTNEDEVLAAMREEYKNLNVVFQSIEFVDLTLAKQMEVIVKSDVVIGMHGAGMVNVFWTRPKTLVVEIFPQKRRRWGYRNLCQFLDCDWHEFRGGRDIGKDKEPNSKDKEILYSDWRAFFDPLFKAKYAQVVDDAQLNDLDDLESASLAAV